MKIARYPLEPQTYQSVEPIPPGTFVAVTVTPRYPEGVPRMSPPGESVTPTHVLELHAYVEPEKQHQAAPILGVWLIMPGQDFPPALVEADAFYRGTVVQHGSPLHVFTAVISYADTTRPEQIKADTVDNLAAQIAARHAARRGTMTMPVEPGTRGPDGTYHPATNPGHS